MQCFAASIIGEAKGFIGEDIEVFCPTPNYTVTSANNSRLFDQVKVLQIYSGYKILIPARASGKGILKCGVIASGNVPQTWNFEILGLCRQLLFIVNNCQQNWFILKFQDMHRSCTWTTMKEKWIAYQSTQTDLSQLCAVATLLTVSTWNTASRIPSRATIGDRSNSTHNFLGAVGSKRRTREQTAQVCRITISTALSNVEVVNMP